MDKKSQILAASFIILILVSIGLTYKRAFVDQNFEIVGLEEEVLEEVVE